MIDPLLFPAEDEQQCRADCRRLDELLRSDVHARCAWLRAMRSADETRSQLEACWDPRYTEVITEHGVLAAFEKHLVPLRALRDLAADPEGLETIADCIQGIEPARGVDDEQTSVVADQLRELLARLRESRDARNAKDVSPEIFSTDRQQRYRGVWTRQGALHRCHIEVSLVAPTMLKLVYAGKTWGALSVRPSGASRVTVLACTGVFLGSPIASELGVRAAAKSNDATLSGEPRIEVTATMGGLCLDIFV